MDHLFLNLSIFYFQGYLSAHDIANSISKTKKLAKLLSYLPFFKNKKKIFLNIINNLNQKNKKPFAKIKKLLNLKPIFVIKGEEGADNRGDDDDNQDAE